MNPTSQKSSFRLPHCLDNDLARLKSNSKLVLPLYLAKLERWVVQLFIFYNKIKLFL